ncbi:DUF3109 family protein [Portibacter marinus]|uniref:DUF3109 family protein n=1 Tax=Portibacter marinus TaxID=2898660 RepID=UPI001F33C915|nr:DUF3109 family protein [Portibacter marinus]
MINIDDKLISDDVVDKNFVCNLEKCKGACCWEGDFGAPLTSAEINTIEQYLDVIKEALPERSKAYIDLKTFHHKYDKDKFDGTAIHPDGACVFLTDEKGIAKCGIEKTYFEGKQPFRKPVSCHLYPIRVKKDQHTGIELINYDKWDICSAACKLGDELKVPVYQFAKEALIRKYGEEFYERLDDIYQQIYQ